MPFERSTAANCNRQWKFEYFFLRLSCSMAVGSLPYLQVRNVTVVNIWFLKAEKKQNGNVLPSPSVARRQCHTSVCLLWSQWKQKTKYPQRQSTRRWRRVKMKYTMEAAAAAQSHDDVEVPVCLWRCEMQNSSKNESQLPSASQSPTHIYVQHAWKHRRRRRPYRISEMVYRIARHSVAHSFTA